MTNQRSALFARSAGNRVVLGVAGGLGEALGIDPLLVRLGLAALTVASGLGIVLYLGAWAVSAAPPPAAPPPPRTLSPATWRPALAVGCIVLGVMLVLRELGVWFGDSLVWPLVVAGCGSVIIWSRTDAVGRARWTAAGGRLVGHHPGDAATALALRTGIGGVLVLAGLSVFLLAHQSAGAIGAELLAVTVTVGGLGLILTPWILGLVGEAAAERRERIRSEERAEIAAHLHDSVLNTLALIQRGEVSPEVASVARRQERELRAWLNGRPLVADAADLRGAIDAVTTRVEALHHVPVDAVVVGDAPLDDAANAICLACQEAATNAARHSGAPRVSIFVEAEAHQITAFVRDQGCGFDADRVPPDRRGISESIIGRMRRLGGGATVTSRRGEGTEVQMHIPRGGS